jgi:hypothetical protein
MEVYFNYINDRTDSLWVDTFANVTKYIRERKNTIIGSTVEGDTIIVNISNDLDPSVYDVSIKLKTYVPNTWETVHLDKRSKQGEPTRIAVGKDTVGSYVLYSVLPAENEIILTK